MIRKVKMNCLIQFHIHTTKINSNAKDIYAYQSQNK